MAGEVDEQTKSDADFLRQSISRLDSTRAKLEEALSDPEKIAQVATELRSTVKAREELQRQTKESPAEADGESEENESDEEVDSDPDSERKEALARLKKGQLGTAEPRLKRIAEEFVDKKRGTQQDKALLLVRLFQRYRVKSSKWEDGLIAMGFKFTLSDLGITEEDIENETLPELAVSKKKEPYPVILPNGQALIDPRTGRQAVEPMTYQEFVNQYRVAAANQSMMGGLGGGNMVQSLMASQERISQTALEYYKNDANKAWQVANSRSKDVVLKEWEAEVDYLKRLGIVGPRESQVDVNRQLAQEIRATGKEFIKETREDLKALFESFKDDIVKPEIDRRKSNSSSGSNDPDDVDIPEEKQASIFTELEHKAKEEAGKVEGKK